MNVLAIGVSAVVVFVVSTVWYIAFAAQWEAMVGERAAGGSEERPPAWMVLLELIRSAVVATAVAGLAAQIEVVGVGQALLLGLVLWIAFPVVLLTGSILWDKVKWQLAAIHAGDWLLKLLVISVIAGLWR